jgi:hypothetical protein
MKSEFEVHETIRQVKIVLDVYDHNQSGVEWFANIWHRELMSFEMAERKRLSYSTKLKLITALQVPKLIESKIQLIILGAMTQSLKEIEHYDKLEDGIEKEYITKATMRLKINLKYLVDMVIPVSLKMSGMLKDLNVDSSSSTLSRYLEIAREIMVIEQWVIQPFNAEDNVGDLVEWDVEKGVYKLKTSKSD